MGRLPLLRVSCRGGTKTVRRNILVLGMALVLLLAGTAKAGFDIPEKLDFDIRWLGIKAGESSLEVTTQEDGRIRIVSTAKSAKWIDIIYKVRDRAVSLIGNSPDWQPVNYRLKTREGRRRKDREIIFGHDGNKALFVDHRKGEKKEYELPERIYDPLSAFYVVRGYDLEVGKSAYVPMFDSKRVYDVEVKVLKKERVKVPAGTFDTILVHPVMKSEGIFASKGEMYIWLTDDEKRIPVKLKAKVKIGSVYAELVGGRY